MHLLQEYIFEKSSDSNEQVILKETSTIINPKPITKL
jgi:hypothetical protein